jgi:hypothetical protein
MLVTFEGKVIESCGFHCWIENRGVGVLGSLGFRFQEPETDTPIRGHQGTYGYVKIDLLYKAHVYKFLRNLSKTAKISLKFRNLQFSFSYRESLSFKKDNFNILSCLVQIM